MARTRPPRLTRAHAAALLLQDDDSTAAAAHRTGLAIDTDGRARILAPNDVFTAPIRHIALTRGELLEAGVRVAAGSGPRLDALLADVNTHLVKSWNTA
ncbi:hypothetical protein ACFFMN_06265 [Planobispora siamensis]|uniref:Uncharacterized protein n=1 Tax=Planobispora siamensis TaxID=936338 RepID=A0A8J3SSZ8_9ACTN|nr:hypothetical protein [Planobispora siamensis]GIH97824.1 hypothetical protein Psi01_84540 [Planobispora siamensis]